MPLILGNPNNLITGTLVLRADSTYANRVTGGLTLRANTLPQVRGTLGLRATTRGIQKLRGTLMLTSGSSTRQLGGGITLRARTGAFQLTGRMALTATTHPTQEGGNILHIGVKPVRYEVTGPAGLKVLGFEFSHTAQGRELSLTLAGAVIMQRSTPLSIKLASNRGGSLELGFVPADGEYEIERLPGGGARTRVRGADREYSLISNLKLDELIPWANNPSREVSAPGYRSATRQVIGVDAILRAAFQAAGQRIILQSPALASHRWEETRRDYSTAGKSPLQIWQESYGLLNYELVRVGQDSWRGYAPGEKVNDVRPDRQYLLPYNQSRQTLQYPASVRVQGGDIFTQIQGYLRDVAESGELPDQVAGPGGTKAKVEVRDPQTALMEANQDAVLRGQTIEGGRVSSYAVVKSGGRVVSSAELVTGDVEAVLELGYDVASPLPVKTFRGVALAVSTTSNTYLNATGGTLAETRTLKRRYAYAYETVLESAALPEPLSTSVQVGTLLGEEETLEQFVWSHQGGHLRQKTTTENRITAVGQENADSTDPARPPKPPVALERNATVTTETWTPIGGGLWRHGVTRGQANKLPVLDLTGGDWLKQIAVPLVSVSSEITDNAPPAVSDPNIPASESQGKGATAAAAPQFPVPPPFEYLRDVNVLTVGLGGDSPQASLSLPMVEDNNHSLLDGYGKLWATELKPRTTRNFRTVALESLTPRTLVADYGLVRSVRASGSAGAFSLEAVCEERDV